MKTMQLRDVKAQLSAVVEEAEAGEPVTITKHGTPVAMVVPIDEGRKLYPEKPKKSFAEHLLAFPGGIDLELERDHTPPREIDL